MINSMTDKGYTASMVFDAEDKVIVGRVLDIDDIVSFHTEIVEAARMSAVLRLPMADSIMLATARAFEAVLWIHDADFEGVDGVRYAPA